MDSDSDALKVFRKKMANPLHWRKANQILQGYTKKDLSNLVRAKEFINELATVLKITLSNEENTAAARWVVSQGIDPQSKKERFSIWKKIK